LKPQARRPSSSQPGAYAWGGAAISLPVFEGGRLAGRYRGSRAEYDAAVATYDRTLIDALQGSDRHLTSRGLAATMRRVGFQSHDGFIFERLVEKGGVLVAIQSESRAADALAVLHSFGGGNAAIGAWAGRV